MKKYTIAVLMLAVLFGISSVFAEGQESKERSLVRDQKTTTPVLDATAIACVKTAITKREDALIAGESAYATAVGSAYTARKTALLSAWDSADAKTRRSAVRAADQAFKSAVQTARKTWNTTRRGAWNTFGTERKACSPSISSSDTGSSIAEASL